MYICKYSVYNSVEDKVFANVLWDNITMTGMSVQGPQHVVVAVKFGFAFLFISFLPWMKVCSVCVLLAHGASPPISSVGTILCIVGHTSSQCFMHDMCTFLFGRNNVRHLFYLYLPGFD